jgi:hypothetical protein
MLVGMTAVFTSCGDDEGGDHTTCEDKNPVDGKCDECGKAVKHKHADTDPADSKCDICGKAMGGGEDETIDYPWSDEEPVKLLFQMSHASDGQQSPSGCLRYLAGEDLDADQDIDSDVADRNADAEYYTNVSVTYQYYDDVAEYGWGKSIEKMFADVSSGSTKDIPDMYCNFTYDMVGASLKGTFANLKNTELKNGNYFSFLDEDYDETVDNEGYMFEYMESTTLSLHKMYILASDYFIDLVRSFFVVPVNKYLLETVGENITTDLDGDGEFTIEDFYKEVWEKKWTYNKVAEYSTAVYKNTGSASGEDIEDVLGFALSKGGLAPSGILYSTNIKVINKEWDDAKGDYEYSYPTESPALYELFDNLKTLMGATGVAYIGDDETTAKYGSSPLLAVRNRFCDNKILFGNIIVVGSLEYEAYQTLRKNVETGGFGVVPVPLYHEVDADDPETYLTSIHNNARPGAISKSTKNFAVCTAFLNYQSTHSADILNEYYNYNRSYGATDGSSGVVEMLQYIRLNVRSAFDKTFEDAIGVYNDIDEKRWHHIMIENKYEYDIRHDYSSLRTEKQGYLDTLYNQYPQLP